VVPSLNQGQFIGENLSSIFNQEYPNLEVVVMDGGSTDNSIDVIQAYRDRLTYWQSRPDKGQAHAINEGMTHCTGDLVGWLNSDDFYCGESLWIVARVFLKFPERGLYIGNGYRLSQEKGKKTPFCPTHVAFNRIALAEGLDYIQQPSTFILHKAWQKVGGLNPGLHYGLDWDLFLRIAEHYPVVLINEFLSASREYGHTKTASGKIKRALELIQIAQERSGKQITLGSAFYLLGTLLELNKSVLPPSLRLPLSDAIDILKKEMAKSWGGDETFPIFSDPQDRTYLPIPFGTSWGRKYNALPKTHLPLISIVLPSHNQAKFLPQALDSIFSQEYPKSETIIFDGLSSDETVQIIERYSEQIAFWRSEPDRDPAQVIQKGFRVASGEILAWMSPEDMLAEGSLWAVAHAFCADPDLDMVVGNALYIDEQNELFLVEESGQRTGLYYSSQEPWSAIPSSWAHTRPLPQPTVFFRRRLIEINEWKRVFSSKDTFDFDLFWRTVRKVKIKKIDSILSLYRPRNSAPQANLSIAVDMTLMLPGGENGGSKVLAMQLLNGFRRLSPEYHLLLLTSLSNHDELKSFDGPRVRRICVLGEQTIFPDFLGKNDFLGLKRMALKIYYALPEKITRLVKKMSRITARVFPVLFHLTSQIHGSRPTSGILNTLGVDLLFCPFTTPTYAEPNIPVVSVFYDLQHLYYPQFFSQSELSRRNSQMDLLRRIPHRIICISEHGRHSLVEHLNIPPERSKTIHIGIQSTLKKPSQPEIEQVRSRLGIRQRPYIFYPANFWPHKNHQSLMNAYSMLLSDRPQTDLDLVFTGALEDSAQELYNLAKNMGLDSRIHFLGFLPEKEFAAVLAGCQMMVFPSIYEGFGIPVLEAMSFGVPVLCSNLTSLPEVAGEAALLFDPSEPQEIKRSIEAILENPDLAIELIQRGHRQASKFREDDMVYEYLNVFAELTRGTKQFGDAINGIFQDGWTSEQILFSFGPGPAGRLCDLQMEVPSWGLTEEVDLQIDGADFSSKKWIIHRGSTLTIQLPLPQEPLRFSMLVEPVFCPRDKGFGPDDRLLGCICHHCQIVYRDGSKKILFELKSLAE